MPQVDLRIVPETLAHLHPHATCGMGFYARSIKNVITVVSVCIQLGANFPSKKTGISHQLHNKYTTTIKSSSQDEH